MNRFIGKRNEEIQHTQAMILKLRTSLKKKILSDNFIFRDDKFNSYNFNVPLCVMERTLVTNNHSDSLENSRKGKRLGHS